MSLQPALFDTDGPSPGGREPVTSDGRGEAPSLVTGAPSRWDSPSTSYAAGASIRTEHIHASMAYVLGLIAEIGPTTDDRLCAVAAQRGSRWTAQRLRTARSELVRRGRVLEADRNGTTSTGRRAKRWSVTPTDRSAA